MTTPNNLKQELAEKFANKTQDDLGDHNSLTQEHRILVANNLAILTEFEQRLYEAIDKRTSILFQGTRVPFVDCCTQAYLEFRQQKGGDEKCAETKLTLNPVENIQPIQQVKFPASPAPKSTEESSGALQCSVCALFFTDVELQPEGTFICDGCANRL